MENHDLKRRRLITSLLFVTSALVPLWVTIYFTYFPLGFTSSFILEWFVCYFMVTNIIAALFYRFGKVWPSNSENIGNAGLNWMALVATNWLAIAILHSQTILVGTPFFEYYSAVLLVNFAVVFLAFRRDITAYVRVHSLI